MHKAFCEKERMLLESIPIEEKSFDTITLQDIFWDYSQFYAHEKAKYIREYRGYSKQIPFFAGKPVKDIRNRDMQDLRKKLEGHLTRKGTSYAPKTVRDIMKLVKMLINHGVLTPEQLTAYKKFWMKIKINWEWHI